MALGEKVRVRLDSAEGWLDLILEGFSNQSHSMIPQKLVFVSFPSPGRSNRPRRDLLLQWEQAQESCSLSTRKEGIRSSLGYPQQPLCRDPAFSRGSGKQVLLLELPGSCPVHTAGSIPSNSLPAQRLGGSFSCCLFLLINRGR